VLRVSYGQPHCLVAGQVAASSVTASPCRGDGQVRLLRDQTIHGDDQPACVSLSSSSARPNEGKYRPNIYTLRHGPGSDMATPAYASSRSRNRLRKRAIFFSGAGGPSLRFSGTTSAGLFIWLYSPDVEFRIPSIARRRVFSARSRSHSFSVDLGRSSELFRLGIFSRGLTTA
jgi:hypothetical protein